MSEILVNKLKADRGAAAICRLCATLRKADCFVHIRDPNLNLIAKLERCCQFTLPEDDHLPENVCVDCVQTLHNCWSFAEKVHEAQESLLALYAVEDVVVEEKDVSHILKRNPSHEEISKTLLRIFQTSDTTKEISNGSLSQELPIDGKSKSCTLVIENVDGGDETDGSVPDNIIEEEYPGETEILEDDTAEFIETSSDHGFNSKVEIIETWRDYPWTCTDCSSVFPGVLELREHIQKEHDSNECTYVCADCSKTYTKYYLFFNHVMTHRSHLRVYCDLCSDFCEQSVILAKHREEHKNEDNVALCSICAKAFKNTVSLYSHLRSHKQEQMYRCEVCDKRFGTKPNLKAHQKIHFGLKEFVCDQCGKGFIQKANLEEHLITHVNETPFECNECGKRFKTSARLAKHKGVHSSVRPHKCEECGKEFREKDTLRVHMRIHTGVMPYKCEFCGKRFRFRSILVTHRHQHTGVRPYSCQECDHHFTNWPNYNKHMKRRHGVSGGTKATQPNSGLNQEKTSTSATKSTDSTSVPIISFHSYSTPELDTSPSELEKILGVPDAKDEDTSADGNGGQMRRVSSGRRGPGSRTTTTASRSLATKR